MSIVKSTAGEGEGATQIGPLRARCDAHGSAMASPRCECEYVVGAEDEVPQGWRREEDPFGRVSRWTHVVLFLHLCGPCLEAGEAPAA